jgi:Ca2+-binding RTX toxin-like protein
MSQSPHRRGRPNRRRLTLVALLVTGISALAAPDAGSVVTIGSDLSGADSTVSCGTPCTAIGTALPGRAVTSPMDGVLVRWRVGNGTGTMVFRVVRNAGGGAYTGVGRSAPATVTAPPAQPGQPPVISTFEARIPVHAGELGGLESDGSASVGSRRLPGAAIVAFIPPLGDNETRAPQAGVNDVEGLVNADIEADADRDGYGDESQDACAKDPATQALCSGPCANDRNGTEGPDAISGTAAGDRMLGLGGDDRLTALAGDDCVSGGPGRDVLSGGGGDDRLNGGPANDVLRGGAGKDVLRGTAGNDTLRGHAGNDRITGAAGRDTIDVGGGRNRASGGPGRDVIRAANRGRDRIACGPGPDRVTADSKDRIARDCERVRIR